MSKCPFHNSNPENTFDISKYDPEIFDESRKVLIANQIYSPSEEIVTASSRREWMDSTHGSFAYRCLPLKMANELGWHILCPYDISVRWNGGPEVSDVEVVGGRRVCSSHFGSGTFTFNFNTIFRTSKGHCLYAKGPTNLPKQHAHALEGLIETDWLTFTFTMNWKITTPNEWIHFKRGEPVCHIFPYPKNYIEEFEPIRKELTKEGLEMFEYYSKSRNHFNETHNTPGTTAYKEKWQKHYFRGEYPDEVRTKAVKFGFEHKLKSGTKPFDDQRESKEVYPEPPPAPPKKKSILFTT